MPSRSCWVANEPSRLRRHGFLKSWLRSRIARLAWPGHGRFLSSDPLIRFKSRRYCRCQVVGKCFCPSPRATTRRRCTRCWRRAPRLWAQHARGPLTQGPRDVLRTRPCWSSDGGPGGTATVGPLQRLQMRFKTAPFVSGSGPVEIEDQALDPLITSLRHWAQHCGLTRRRAVVERRHCQRASSDDARARPAYRPARANARLCRARWLSDALRRRSSAKDARRATGRLPHQRAALSWMQASRDSGRDAGRANVQ